MLYSAAKGVLSSDMVWSIGKSILAVGGIVVVAIDNKYNKSIADADRITYGIHAMIQFTNVTVYLRDYNRRIMDYLNDRHKAVNDNQFTVAVEVVDSRNLNDYVCAGM